MGRFSHPASTARWGCSGQAEPGAKGGGRLGNGREERRPLWADAPGTVPLAARMRPRTLDELVGMQQHIGLGTPLRGALDAGRLPSLILWGPPGCGKTTLARLLAEAGGAQFHSLSAVESGVGELRAVLAAARAAPGRTVLFVDELHRWSRAQQDAALPHVESGLLTLIGATTENPSFEVVSALLSRCRVMRLAALAEADLGVLLRRAVADERRGVAALRVALDPEGERQLCALAGGDARVALSLLELAATATPPEPDGSRRLTAAVVAQTAQRRALRHDRAGDSHYDVISALIKSVRGSDPDAALYWLARLLEAGEDPLFVARRLVLLASEDIGLADPAALPLAVAAWQAAQFVGMPEGYLPLTQATLHLALAPKSNSVLRGYRAAAKDVADHPELEVPLHLRNAVTGLMRASGYGAGYRYAHDHPGGVAAQHHLPDELRGRHYYVPGGLGAERALAARLAELRRRLQGGGGDPGRGS